MPITPPDRGTAAAFSGLRPDPDLRIEEIGIRPYALPLLRPWTSVRGTRTERRGWLLQVRAAGLWGYGDCAPLPEAGTEGEAEALAALRRWQARLTGQSLDALLDPGRQPPFGTPSGHPSGTGVTPAAHFALDCALADLAARLIGVPLRRWLAPGAGDAVPVNATLGTLRDQTPARIAAACLAGYQVLKLKVGLEAPDIELARLSELVAHLSPTASLRLDANGAWDYDQAARLIARLNDLPIESLEEPLTIPDWQALRSLQAQARFPLALDESLHLPPPLIPTPTPATSAVTGAVQAHPSHGPETGVHVHPPHDPAQMVTDHTLGGMAPVAVFPVDRLLAAGDPPVRRLVLKPAAVGGLQRTLTLGREAAHLGLEVVLTSLIESAAGLWPSLQLAAAISSPLAQGLATSPWLVQDLGRVPHPEQGRIWLGQDSGSGFIPRGAADPDTLE